MTLPGYVFRNRENQAINNRERTSSTGRLLIALGALIAAAPLWAAGLGDIELQSHLNEPLAATIQIIGGASEGEMSVRLGDGEAYERLGLIRPRMLERVQVLMETTASGPRVRIAGDAPVTDLILDLVLILIDGASEQTRHYPVLLDFSTAESIAVSAAPRRRVRESSATARPAPSRSRSALQASGKSYGPVQPGETLSGIASLIKGNQQVRSWAVVEALHELNPDAFIDGDMDRLKVGAVLQIPALEGLVATTIRRASSAATAPGVVRQTPPRSGDRALSPAPARRPGGPRPDSRLEIIGTPNSAQILDSMGELLEQDDVELAAQGQEARRQLAFATAEIQTYRNENEQLRRQVEDLEARVVSLNRLIELRAAANAAAEPAAAEEVTPAPSAAAGADVDAGARAAEDARLTLPGDASAAGGKQRAWYSAWLPWSLALVLLLAAAVLLLWLRSRREEQRRRERTADLVNRIRQAADRAAL